MGIRNSNGTRKGICRTEENMESVLLKPCLNFSSPNGLNVSLLFINSEARKSSASY